MFENNEMNLFGGNGMDLGSDNNAGFAAFPSFGEDDVTKAPETDESKNTNNAVMEEVSTPSNIEGVDKNVQTNSVEDKKTDGSDIGSNKTEDEKNEEVTNADEANVGAGNNAEEQKQEAAADFFAQTLAKAEELEAESAKSILIDKLPIFTYGGAKEEIVDTSKTFDALRVEKAEDFPELDDFDAVSWKMTYGTITKSVSTPKKTTIASLKKQIEDSKEFGSMLKKAKEIDKLECKIVPSVVAKKKGTASSYKGAFLSLEEAKQSDKNISFVPSDDGNVYEMRTNDIGTFIAKADKVTILDKVRAGFIPALPKIPYKHLEELISFFKSFVNDKSELEALAYIFWSVESKEYFVYVPNQNVSKTRIESKLPTIDEEKFTLVMEIHSHNTMPAFFSSIDNKDEKATRLYAVVGELDNFFPDIKVRCSVGGKFVDINPHDVFESISCDFPEEWKYAVNPAKKEASV